MVFQLRFSSFNSSVHLTSDFLAGRILFFCSWLWGVYILVFQEYGILCTKVKCLKNHLQVGFLFLVICCIDTPSLSRHYICL